MDFNSIVILFLIKDAIYRQLSKVILGFKDTIKIHYHK